jgi:hypothetical protein
MRSTRVVSARPIGIRAFLLESGGKTGIGQRSRAAESGLIEAGAFENARRRSPKSAITGCCE